MNVQKTLLATLAGFVALFGLGYVIYILLFPSAQFATAASEGVMREYFPGIIIFELLYAFLLAYIFGKWSGIKTFNTGLKEGAVIGLILGLCTSLWMYSTTLLVEADVIWYYAITFAIRFGVAGGLIGWVYGRD